MNTSRGGPSRVDRTKLNSLRDIVILALCGVSAVASTIEDDPNRGFARDMTCGMCAIGGGPLRQASVATTAVPVSYAVKADVLPT
jgi:hypothetical protein